MVKPKPARRKVPAPTPEDWGVLLDGAATIAISLTLAPCTIQEKVLIAGLIRALVDTLHPPAAKPKKRKAAK